MTLIYHRFEFYAYEQKKFIFAPNDLDKKWPTVMTSLKVARDNLGVDVEWRTRHVLVAPLDEDDVIALLLHDVVHAVAEAAAVLDDDLLARRLRAVDSDEEAVVAGLGAIDGETVPAVDESRF